MTDILEQARALIDESCEWRDLCKQNVAFDEPCECRKRAAAILALAEPKWREIDDVAVDKACAAYEGAFIFGDNNWRNQMRAALEAAFVLPLPPKEEQ